jgi:hypothetical protein
VDVALGAGTLGSGVTLEIVGDGEGWLTATGAGLDGVCFTA